MPVVIKRLQRGYDAALTPPLKCKQSIAAVFVWPAVLFTTPPPSQPAALYPGERPLPSTPDIQPDHHELTREQRLRWMPDRRRNRRVSHRAERGLHSLCHAPLRPGCPSAAFLLRPRAVSPLLQRNHGIGTHPRSRYRRCGTHVSDMPATSGGQPGQPAWGGTHVMACPKPIASIYQIQAIKQQKGSATRGVLSGRV